LVSAGLAASAGAAITTSFVAGAARGEERCRDPGEEECSVALGSATPSASIRGTEGPCAVESHGFDQKGEGKKGSGGA